MTSPSTEEPRPRVSVVVAARNVANYIDETLASLSAQSLSDFEVLIVDDRSTDDTPMKLQIAARGDPRLRLLTGEGRGPAAARNLAIRQARGDWIAVIDGDDLIAPSRLEGLVREGERLGADIIADNLVAFYDDDQPNHPWLTGDAWARPRTIEIEDYLETRGDAGSENRLGYLKPLFRVSAFRPEALMYDETLFIGEDYDLVARCLLAGADFHYVPYDGYFYRRHSASISHRIAPAQLAGIVDGLNRLRESAPARLHPAFDQRLEMLQADLRFVEAVEKIKRGKVTTLVEALSTPSLRRRLVQAAREGLQRRLRR